MKRVYGIVTFLLLVITILIAKAGNTVEEKDISVIIFLVPALFYFWEDDIRVIRKYIHELYIALAALLNTNHKVRG